MKQQTIIAVCAAPVALGIVAVLAKIRPRGSKPGRYRPESNLATFLAKALQRVPEPTARQA